MAIAAANHMGLCTATEADTRNNDGGATPAKILEPATPASYPMKEGEVVAPALIKNRGNDAKADRELANLHLAELAQHANEPLKASPELVEKIAAQPIPKRAPSPDEFPRLSPDAQALVARQRR